jgi:cellulose synthase/poly-beta-1,6-N-acetylglucosamine synthase-like glycosyltransferase
MWPEVTAAALPRRRVGRNGAPWTLLALAGGATAAAAALGLDVFVGVAGLAIQVVFVVFFVRHLAFAIAAARCAPADLDAPEVDGGCRPPVSVLVACRNEEAVVERLVGSLLDLDYPPERLQVVIVDDGSTDRTGELLDRVAERDERVVCIHRRAGASGGKSGALNAAREATTGEIVVVFDADHRPRRDCVRRLVRHFQDERVAAVQGRCEIANGEDSALSRLVEVDYLSGYLVNQYGRQCVFQLPAYGGANCAVRASALRAAGGWNEDSVTEDTDLTLRLVLGGDRVRYDATAVDAEEAVQTLAHYWRQRYRWARGHQQVWRDYRAAVWRSPLSLVKKVETTMFLLAFHLPVLSGVGLVLVGLWATGVAVPPAYVNPYFLWTLLFLGPLAELATGLLVARADRRRVLVLALFLPLFLVSIALCTKAWLDGLLGRRYSWVKTVRAGDLDTEAVAA